MQRKPSMGMLFIALSAFLSQSMLFCMAANTGPASDEQDVFTVVIRYQMEKWIEESDRYEAQAKTEIEKKTAKQLNYKIVFVSIKGRDPSDDFISRLQNVPRVIRKASSEESQKGPHIPIDKVTPQAGIVFSADSVKWIGSDSAEVEGGYYCGGLCAAGLTFTVTRQNGKWVVKHVRKTWIS